MSRNTRRTPKRRCRNSRYILRCLPLHWHPSIRNSHLSPLHHLLLNTLKSHWFQWLHWHPIPLSNLKIRWLLRFHQPRNIQSNQKPQLHLHYPQDHCILNIRYRRCFLLDLEVRHLRCIQNIPKSQRCQRRAGPMLQSSPKSHLSRRCRSPRNLLRSPVAHLLHRCRNTRNTRCNR